MRSLSLAAVLCAVSPAVAQSLALKVLVIGIDGVRGDAFDAAATPKLDALVANGTYANGVNLAATISGPGWSNVLCGVGMSKHGVCNNSFSGSNYAQYPSFFTRIRQVCPNALLASIVHWTPVTSQIVTDVDWELSGNDASVASQAAQLLATDNSDVMFLHFVDVDRAGHGSGFSPTNRSYLTAISTVDSLIGNVVAAVDARPNRANENRLYIVMSDHGGV